MDGLDGTISSVTCFSSSHWIVCQYVNNDRSNPIQSPLILWYLVLQTHNIHRLYIYIVLSCIVYCIIRIYWCIYRIQNVQSLYLLSISHILHHITSTFLNSMQNQTSTPSHNKKTHIEWKNSQLPNPTPTPKQKTCKKKTGGFSTRRHKTTPKKLLGSPNIDVVEQLCSSVEKIRAQNGFPRLGLDARVSHTK